MKDDKGLGFSMGMLSRLSGARSRSISPENPSGQPGQGGRAVDGTGASASRGLGVGWKVSPSVHIGPQQEFVLADIATPGAIRQIWLTALDNVPLRDLILRFYWDGQPHPSVEVPLGDFFCCGLEGFAPVVSLPVCVNPGRAFNCFWEMPYRQSAKVTLENREPQETATVYYQINYVESDVPDDCAYFHAQFRRSNPVRYKEVHTILDRMEGQGHYVGTYMTWGTNSNGWWGEGEVKFYIDDDKEFPTICGTGTEDYFLGSHNFDTGAAVRGYPAAYTPYTTPYAGLCEIQQPDGLYRSQQRFGMYRWHIVDPVRFRERLRITIQALGWRNSRWDTDIETRRYLPLRDDLSSVAFWYQTLPSLPFPALPERDLLAVD